MSGSSLSDEAALIVGFRVDKKSVRGWSQPKIEGNSQRERDEDTITFQNQNSTKTSSLFENANNETASRDDASIPSKFQMSQPEKKMEEWYKAQYFDYYFKSYKANGLDDATSSQYAHACVSELERTGYIRNAIISQMTGGDSGSSTNNKERSDNTVLFNSSAPRSETFKQSNTFHSKNSNKKKLQNWIHKLINTYRSNGTSQEDVEWNSKLYCYSKYISERYDASNKNIDWELQKLPSRETIQNFKIKQGKEADSQQLPRKSSHLNLSNNYSLTGSYETIHANSLKDSSNIQNQYFNQTVPAANPDPVSTSSYTTSHTNCNNNKIRKRFTSKLESKDENHTQKNEEISTNCYANEDESSLPLIKKTKTNGRKTKKPDSNHSGSFETELHNKSNDQQNTDHCYILDADGNKRLSWKQILALGRSTEKIIGLSNALEKPYLRLTASPDPNMVRPEHVLRKSLEYVLGNYISCNFGSLSTCNYPFVNKKTKTRNVESKKKYDWKYLEEQFRSIRQDLTVQGIKNNFTIQVYEINGRIALENHDLGQFNQCQARLKELYSINLVEFEYSNREEFLCYYIIYLTLQNMKTDIIRILDEVQPYKEYKGIKFALQISKSIMDGNYTRYFKLCKSAPWESRHLLDIFRDRQLIIALTTMSKAFRFIEVPLITSSLGFDSNRECISFLKSHNAVFAENRDADNIDVNLQTLKLDCKSSFPIFSSSPLLLSRKVQALG